MTGHTVSILGSFNSMSCLPPAKRRRVHGLGHDWRRRTFSRMAVGGAFVLRGMPDGTIYPAQQAAARSRFRSCRMVRFIRHNKQLRVRTSVMSGGAIQPTQQAAARLCFGACRAVRFIQHNNRRRVRASGYAGKYDSSGTTSGGATDRTDPSRRLPVALHITYSIIIKPHEHLRTARAFTRCALAASCPLSAL